MKLWIIPWPWDYHHQGGLVVMATTQQAALNKARKWFDKNYGDDDWNYRRPAQPQWRNLDVVGVAGGAHPFTVRLPLGWYPVA